MLKQMTAANLKVLVLLACIVSAACSPQSQEVVQIPTLMVLPSETFTQTITPSPSETPTPSDTPTPTATLTPSSTFTPVPTDTPVRTNTPTVPPCDTAFWENEADPLITQFLDTADVAASTARASLSGVLLELRQVQREFERLDAPDCLREEFRMVTFAMDSAVEGFNAFLARDEIGADVFLEFATIHFWTAQEQLQEHFIFGDIRMGNTAGIIWGGPDPHPATATWLARE